MFNKGFLNFLLELRRLIGVEPITIVIRNGRLRWYGHVMRKSEDWVNKCMEFRVEGRRPVGSPMIWLESVVNVRLRSWFVSVSVSRDS